MKKSAKTCKKIVIKVGSSVLTGGSTSIVSENLSRIVHHIVSFIKDGNDVILVTSGAVASGLLLLGFKQKPNELSELQAAAAVGQNILMQAYNMEFEKFGLKGAQILLTQEDFSEKRNLNAVNTINTLLAHKIIPIINENDAISVDEIRFGDNDTLSAKVAKAVKADGLVILSDIDGIYKNFDPKTKKGERIPVVNKITPEIEKLACGTDKTSCVGGMSTKVEAVKIATGVGIPVVLVDGLKEDLQISFIPPSSIYEHRADGTIFPAIKFVGAGESKRNWMAYEAKVKGRIVVDAGAKVALVKKGSSLLAVGVTSVSGNFKAGDIVEIVDAEGNIFAKGKVNFSSGELKEIKGKKNKDEVIHRDDLALLG